MGSALHAVARSFVKLPLLQRLLLQAYEESFRLVYYHMVRDQTLPYYFDRQTPPETFRNQIRFFKKRYEIISIYEALERIRCGESLKRTLAITTDDGFVENHSVIAPILAEEKVTATFFLVGNCIDNRALMWRNKLLYIRNQLPADKLDALMHRMAAEEAISPPLPGESVLAWSTRLWRMADKDRLSDRLWTEAGLMPIEEWLSVHRPFLSIRQIKELVSAGFDIGAHTKSHPYCHKLTYEELEEETIGSQRQIEALTGIPVNLFAYPFGARPARELERKLIANNSGDIKTLLGIQNKLSNFGDPMVWERDSMEKQYEESILSYVMGPLKRKYIGGERHVVKRNEEQ